MAKAIAAIITCLMLIVLLVIFGQDLRAHDTVLAWPGGEINLADCRGSERVNSMAGSFTLIPVGLIDVDKAFGRVDRYCRLSITRSANNPLLVGNTICLVPTQEGKINLLGRVRKSRQDWPKCIGQIKYRNLTDTIAVQ